MFCFTFNFFLCLGLQIFRLTSSARRFLTWRVSQVWVDSFSAGKEFSTWPFQSVSSVGCHTSQVWTSLRSIDRTIRVVLRMDTWALTSSKEKRWSPLWPTFFFFVNREVCRLLWLVKFVLCQTKSVSLSLGMEEMIFARLLICHLKAGPPPPLEAILVIFGRRALIFFLFESSWKKMKNDTTFVRMRSGDHLGDAKMSKKGTSLRRI